MSFKWMNFFLCLLFVIESRLRVLSSSQFFLTNVQKRTLTRARWTPLGRHHNHYLSHNWLLPDDTWAKFMMMLSKRSISCSRSACSRRTESCNHAMQLAAFVVCCTHLRACTACLLVPPPDLLSCHFRAPFFNFSLSAYKNHVWILM
jgi:hypothetical protein